MIQVVASKPENRARFQRIGFDLRGVDVMAAGTFERSDVKRGRPRALSLPGSCVRRTWDSAATGLM